MCERDLVEQKANSQTERVEQTVQNWWFYINNEMFFWTFLFYYIWINDSFRANYIYIFIYIFFFWWFLCKYNNVKLKFISLIYAQQSKVFFMHQKIF